MNNLYGSCMVKPLPVSDFKFWTEDELRKGLDVTKIPSDSETG